MDKKLLSVIHKALWLEITFVLLVNAACKISDENNCIVLQREYDILTRESDSDIGAGFVVQQWVDSCEHIISKGIRYPQNQYILYDCSTNQVLDSVDLMYKKFIRLEDAILIGKDSFLVALDAYYAAGFHDAFFLVLNRKKEILDTIKVDALPVRTRAHLMEKDCNRHYIFYDSNFPLIYKQHKIFVPLLKWDDQCKTTSGAVGYITYFGKKGDANFTQLPITYPAPPAGYCWPMWYRMPRCAILDNYLFIMFGLSPTLFKYDINTGKLESSDVNFETIGKISPYHNYEEAMSEDPYKSAYCNLVSDSVNNLLYVTARIGCSKQDGPLVKKENNFIYSFLVLDQNLNLLGEGLIPQNYLPYILPYKKGFLLLKKDSPRKTYTYFTYHFEKKEKNYLIEQISWCRDSLNALSPKLTKEQSYIAYLKKIMREDFDRYSSFLLYSKSACPSCIPMYQKVLVSNKQNILNNKVAILMINTDTAAVEGFCQTVDGFLCNDKAPLIMNKIPIYWDNKSAIDDYLCNWVNVMYVAFDERGHLITEININPSDTDKLDKILQHSVKK